MNHHLCSIGWTLYDEYVRKLAAFERLRKPSAHKLSDLRAAKNNYDVHRLDCRECSTRLSESGEDVSTEIK
jgi:hypothetical protein